MGSSQMPAARSPPPLSVEEEAAAVELCLGLSVGAPLPPATCSSSPALSYQRWRREYHALRRREARRKQEEKHMRKSAAAAVLLRRKSSSGDAPPAKAREAAESKFVAGESAPTAFFCPAPISVKTKPAPAAFHVATANASINTAAVGYAVLPMQCYPPMPYVPCTVNPYNFPYMVPCWAPPVAASVVEEEKRVMQPVAALGVPVMAGEENVVDEKSFADVSDFLNFSSQGVARGSKCTSSNETKSESSLTVATGDGPAQPPAYANIPYQPLPLPEKIDKNATIIKLLPPKELEGASSTTKKTPDSAPEKRKKVDGEAKEIRASPERMPCVEARGDGQEGKTVTGYLYRYTKADVSIMCVCHGQSFSPAEFLLHAGISDTSEPLRKIVVVSPTGG